MDLKDYEQMHIKFIEGEFEWGTQVGIGYSLYKEGEEIRFFAHAVKCSADHPEKAVEALRLLANHLEAKLQELK